MISAWTIVNDTFMADLVYTDNIAVFADFVNYFILLLFISGV